MKHQNIACRVFLAYRLFSILIIKTININVMKNSDLNNLRLLIPYTFMFDFTEYSRIALSVDYAPAVNLTQDNHVYGMFWLS